VVCANVCFVTASQKWRIITLSTVMQTSYVNLEEGATNTYEKIQKPFNNDSLSLAQIFWWPKDFVNGREMVDLDAPPL
jgi:hypothetical protein